MVLGLDASVGTIPYLAAIKSGGYTFVGRYYTNLARTRNPAKVLRPNEAYAISQAGLSILAVWELLDTAGYFTEQQGEADGIYAYQYADQIIKQPEGSAIYFAVDFDATQQQYLGSIVPYFRGVNTGFAKLSAGAPAYDIGVYGSGAVCSALKSARLARYAWLAQSTGWSGSRVYSGWDVRQGATINHSGLTCEPDEAQDAFGAFRLQFTQQDTLFT